VQSYNNNSENNNNVIIFNANSATCNKALNNGMRDSEVNLLFEC